MKLRTRLFLFVTFTIVCMQALYFIWTFVSVSAHVKSVRSELIEEIKDYNRTQVHDYRTFLTLSIAEQELRINSLFNKVQEFSWLKERYEPSTYNFETNQWANSTMLIASHHWLDFVQTTVSEKLTSQIMMRPPYLHSLVTVPLDDVITLVVQPSTTGQADVYVGVPFWTNKVGEQLELGLHDILFSLDSNRNNWLLFTVEQLINMNPADLYARNKVLPDSPIEPTIGILNEVVYQKLTASTIAMILLVRNHILKNPKILQVLREPDWLKDKISTATGGHMAAFPRGLDTCDSYICQFLKRAGNDSSWTQIHDYQERDDQNRLIWELGTITSTGMWYFDPLNRFAPKGVASFPRKDSAMLPGETHRVGYAVLAEDVFKNERIQVSAGCKTNGKDGLSTCIIPDFQIIRPAHDFSAIFLVNTLLYEMKEKKENIPTYGALTAGVNISPILEKLALISPNRVLFIPKKGNPLMFDTNGKAVDLTIAEKSILSHLSGKNEGIVTDTDQKQYYFLHVTNVTRDDGQVFIIQFKDSVFARIYELKKQASKFMLDILLQILVIGIAVLILVILIVNFYVKRLLGPIQDLAAMTEIVSKGELDAVIIPEKDKIRKDEIGMLVNSFEAMVVHMKEGNKVRSILNKVVNKEVADQIIKQGVELGGELRNIAILFSDIRNFTALSEHMKPQDVLGVLNDCLTVLSKMIDEHNGVIDKYVGDEIMAFFGAPVPMENSTLKAISCAIAMMRVLEEWNRFRVSKGEVELKIGIGVHIGEVIAGNTGAENHLNYTILGHNVNLASRLCDHAKEMEILITEDVLNAPGIRQAIEVEAMPDADFKGISMPVKIYKVKFQ